MYIYYNNNDVKYGFRYNLALKSFVQYFILIYNNYRKKDY